MQKTRRELLLLLLQGGGEPPPVAAAAARLLLLVGADPHLAQNRYCCCVGGIDVLFDSFAVSQPSFPYIVRGLYKSEA